MLHRLITPPKRRGDESLKGSTPVRGSQGGGTPFAADAQASVVTNSSQWQSGSLDGHSLASSMATTTQGSMNYAPGQAGGLHRWQAEKLWLCITLKEAKNLGVFDIDTHSSDPFAKLRITKSGMRGVMVTEMKTRIVHRNLSPLFEESLLCPLGGLTLNCIFKLTLCDSDLLRDEFMGKVKCTLGQLLEHVEGPHKPWADWFALAGQSHRTNAEGEVKLEVKLLTYDQVEEMRKTQERYRRLGFLEARYRDSQLEVQLHTLRCARRVQNVQDLAQNLSLKVRVGRSMMTKPIKARVIKGAASDRPLELAFDEKIPIPLKSAFRGDSSWSSKATDEAADVIIYLCYHKEQLCKTQVPLWVVPLEDDPLLEGSTRTSRDVPADAAAHVHGSVSASALSLPSLDKRDSTATNDSPTKLAQSVTQEGEERVGQLFVRTMEPYKHNLDCALGELEFTLDCIKAPKVDSSAGAAEGDDAVEVVEGFEDDEESRNAPPMANVPPPLETVVYEATFPVGPCSLYQLIFKSDSALAEKVAKSEGLTDMNVGPWEHPDGSEAIQGRTRTVKYTKPLSIPVPFAPKEAQVTEVHKLVAKEGSGFVVEAVVTTSAPKGDTFRVVNQVVGLRGATAASSTLRVSMMVDFLKPPGFLKGAITGGSLKDTTKHWEEVGAAIRAAVASASRSKSAPAAAAAAAPVAADAAPPPSAAPKRFAAPAWLPRAVLVALLVLVVAVVVPMLLWPARHAARAGLGGGAGAAQQKGGGGKLECGTMGETALHAALGVQSGLAEARQGMAEAQQGMVEARQALEAMRHVLGTLVQQQQQLLRQAGGEPCPACPTLASADGTACPEVPQCPQLAPGPGIASMALAGVLVALVGALVPLMVL